MTKNKSKSNLFWFAAMFIMLLVLVGGLFFLARSIMPKKGPYFRTITGEKKHKVYAPARPLSSYRPAAKKIIKLGKKLFVQHCTSCHGKNGMGDGRRAEQLIPKPTPYVWGEFRYGNRYKDIFQLITKGTPNRGSGMMAWSWMPKEHREALTHYVLFLCAQNAKIVNKKVITK